MKRPFPTSSGRCCTACNTSINTTSSTETSSSRISISASRITTQTSVWPTSFYQTSLTQREARAHIRSVVLQGTSRLRFLPKNSTIQKWTCFPLALCFTFCFLARCLSSRATWTKCSGSTSSALLS